MHDDQNYPACCPFRKTRALMLATLLRLSHTNATPWPDTPNPKDDCLKPIDIGGLSPSTHSQQPPQILTLYGSLRDRSFSRLAAEEGGRILERLGAGVRFFSPAGLPLVDDGVDASHPKVAELRELVIWSEGMVW